MEDVSWILLYRKISDNEFYFSERFDKMHAWIDLLLLAGYKNNTFYIRGNEIKLVRGQLAYSIKTLAKRWKWNERTVDKFLSMLSKREMIHYRKTHLTTIITIQNYDRYQTIQHRLQNRIHTNNKEIKNKKTATMEYFDRGGNGTY